VKITFTPDDGDKFKEYTIDDVYQFAITCNISGLGKNMYRRAIIDDKHQLMGQLETLKLDVGTYGSTSK